MPVPKSGYLGDPNKWRGVTLMDIGSKIFSSILCTRLFKIIKKHGVKYQFRSTPGVGCQDGSFMIKTMLQFRYNHILPTFIMFADIVRAFDTSNHKLMVEILKKYDYPPKLCSTIRRMYTDNNVRLILGKIDTFLPFLNWCKTRKQCRTGNIFIHHDGILGNTRRGMGENDLQMIKFRRKRNSPQSSGRITSHPAKSFSQGILF